MGGPWAGPTKSLPQSLGAVDNLIPRRPTIQHWASGKRKISQRQNFGQSPRPGKPKPDPFRPLADSSKEKRLARPILPPRKFQGTKTIPVEVKNHPPGPPRPQTATGRLASKPKGGSVQTERTSYPFTFATYELPPGRPPITKSSMFSRKTEARPVSKPRGHFVTASNTSFFFLPHERPAPPRPGRL